MSYSLWTTPKKFGINLPIRASVNPFISSSSPRLSQKKNVYSFMTFFSRSRKENTVLISFAKVLLCLELGYLFSAIFYIRSN